MLNITEFRRTEQRAVFACLTLGALVRPLELSAVNQVSQPNAPTSTSSRTALGEQRLIGEWASGSGTLRLKDDGVIVQIDWFSGAEVQRRGTYEASNGVLNVKWRERVYAGRTTALDRTERSTFVINGSNLIITTYNDIVKKDVEVRWRRSK